VENNLDAEIRWRDGRDVPRRALLCAVHRSCLSIFVPPACARAPHTTDTSVHPSHSPSCLEPSVLKTCLQPAQAGLSFSLSPGQDRNACHRICGESLYPAAQRHCLRYELLLV